MPLKNSQNLLFDEDLVEKAAGEEQTTINYKRLVHPQEESLLDDAKYFDGGVHPSWQRLKEGGISDTKRDELLGIHKKLID